MTLFVRDGEDFRPASAEDVFGCARALPAQRFHRGSRVLGSPAVVREFLRVQIAPLDHEVFGLIHLDARHRLIALEPLFRGTVDEATVHVREVVRSVLEHAAATAILFHNNPSDVARPSAADEAIARQLRDALALVEVRILDHLIVGEEVFSFAERGLL